jgi:hypothetical protein
MQQLREGARMATKQGDRYDEKLVKEIVGELKLARRIAEAIEPSRHASRQPAPPEVVLHVFDLLDTKNDPEGEDLLTDLKKAQEVAKDGLGLIHDYDVPYQIVLHVFDLLFSDDDD